MEPEATTATTSAPSAPAAPVPVSPAGEPKPPLPPGAPLAETIPELLKTYEEHLHTLAIAERLLDPNAPAQTFGELFSDTNGGLDVFGDRYPMFDELKDFVVTEDLLKGPRSKLRTSRRQLEASLKRLQQAQDQIKRRLRQRARAAVRKIKNGTKETRRWGQTLDVRELAPFAAGTHENRLLFTNSGTFLVLGVKLDPVTHDARAALSLNPAALVNVMKEAVLLQYNNLLDHTASIKMLGATDKVTREVRITAILNHEGLRHTMPVTVTNGTFQFGAPSAENVGKSVDDGIVTLETSVSYKLKVRQADVDSTTADLEMLEDLPVYRTLVALDDDPFADEDDELDLDDDVADEGEDEEELDEPVELAKDETEDSDVSDEAEEALAPAPSASETAGAAAPTPELDAATDAVEPAAPAATPAVPIW